MADEKDLDRGDELKTDGDGPGETGDSSKKDEDLGDPSKELGLEEKKEPLIPKGRFDEAVKKARDEAAAATKRADDLEAQLKANLGEINTQKLEDDIDAAEEKLQVALTDGNKELSTALRREIRQLNRQISDSAAAAHAARATAVAVEQIRYDALVGSMEVEHPELNPDNEETYSQDVVDELTEFKSAFEASGLSSSESLKKALKAVYRGGAKPKAEEEEKEEKEEKKPDEAAKRKEEAIKKGIEAKKKQPADGRKTGLDSDKAGMKSSKTLDPKKLTEKEWDSLDEDTKKRMRGDDFDGE